VRSPVEIVDVSPRDGLQSDPSMPPTAIKIALVERLIAAGVKRLEATSFVNPERVPQMADADDLMAALPRVDDVSYIGLVLNERGFHRAIEAGVDEINVVVVVSDTFSERNQGMTTDASIETWQTIAAAAAATDVKTSVTLAASFGCPYEGEVPVARLVDVFTRVAAFGPEEIALADSIGAAVPTDVTERLDAVAAHAGEATLRCHFHNTRNTGFANVAAAVGAGVTVIDASLGGIGGCPFAPKATGNIATEDVAYLLERMGHPTGLDLRALCESSEWLEDALEHPVPGLLSKAGMFPQSA
jgi:hydroxymethylglutaryl-CoA lyase